LHAAVADAVDFAGERVGAEDIELEGAGDGGAGKGARAGIDREPRGDRAGGLGGEAIRERGAGAGVDDGAGGGGRASERAGGEGEALELALGLGEEIGEDRGDGADDVDRAFHGLVARAGAAGLAGDVILGALAHVEVEDVTGAEFALVGGKVVLERDRALLGAFAGIGADGAAVAVGVVLVDRVAVDAVGHVVEQLDGREIEDGEVRVFQARAAVRIGRVGLGHGRGVGL